MTVIAIMLLMTKLTTLFVLIRYITSKSFQQYFFFPTCFPLKIDLLYRLSFELQQKEKKFHFRKISAVNNFRQLRISDGLIFGQKKIRNFVPPKFVGFNVVRKQKEDETRSRKRMLPTMQSFSYTSKATKKF